MNRFGPRIPFPPPGVSPHFPGNMPVPPPLAPSVVPGTDEQEFASSVQLTNGNPQLLASIHYPEPRPIAVRVRAPWAEQPFAVQKGIILDSNGAALWVLGTAIIGMAGKAISFNFDIPLFQDCVFQGVCESLKLTARLIFQPLNGIQTIGREAFDNPPIFTGVTEPSQGIGSAGDPAQVYIECTTGAGNYGLSNLTRRMQALDLAPSGDSLLLPTPTGADRYEVLADPKINVTSLIIGHKALSPFFEQKTIATYPADCCVRPVPANMLGVDLINSDGARTLSAEVVWHLGLAGFTS